MATISRRLTDGEIALARTVFGDAIDYARVQIHNGKFIPLQPADTGMAPNGSLYMPGRLYRADYAADRSLQALFIHEMTHVWQFQNKVLDPVVAFGRLLLAHKFNYAAAYHYDIKQGCDFTAYGMEQQARIVEDYFTLKTFGHIGSIRPHNALAHADMLAAYETVLADFIKDPSYCKRSKLSDPFPHLKKKP